MDESRGRLLGEHDVLDALNIPLFAGLGNREMLTPSQAVIIARNAIRELSTAEPSDNPIEADSAIAKLRRPSAIAKLRID